MREPYVAIGYITLLWDVFLFVRFFDTLLPKRKNIHTGIIILVLFSVQCLKQFIPLEIAKALVSVMIDIGIIALLFRGKIALVAFYAVVNYIFMSLCDGITLAAYSIFGLYEVDSVSQYEKIHICIGIASRAMLPLFQVAFVRLWPRTNRAGTEFFYYPLPVCILLVLFYFFPLEGKSLYFTHPEWLFFIVIAFMLIALLCFVLAERFKNRERRYAKKVEILEAHQKEQRKYITEILETYKGLATRVHDERHHLELLNAFIFDGRLTKAQEYVQSVYKELDKSFINFTGNTDVDSILHSKLLICPKNITMSVHGRLPKTIEWLDTADLCVLLANALSNAIEACEPIENAVIKVEFIYREWLVIGITNPVNEPPMKDRHGRYTSKKGQGHGYGLMSIDAVVQKYHGHMNIEIDNGFFTMDILLQKK